MKKVKEHKVVHSAPVLPSPPFGLLIGSLTVSLFASLVLYKFLRRKKIAQPLRRPTVATEKQMEFLAELVSQQNFYRAKQLTLAEWLSKEGWGEVISSQLASKFINMLKSQNSGFRKKFEAQKKKAKVGHFRGSITVSDLQQFKFCERASYYSSHQYPSQNVYEVKSGVKLHLRYFGSKNEARDFTKNSRVLDHVKQIEPDAAWIEKLEQTSVGTFYHRSLKLSGKPDGLLHFQDGTKAIIEFKTVEVVPQNPWASDVVQAEAYAILASDHMELRKDVYVLYMNRSRREFALFVREKSLTEYDLAGMVAKIMRARDSIEELELSKSGAKCKSCGYRSICSERPFAERLHQ